MKLNYNIIESFLDTDYYTFTVGYFYWKHFKGTEVEYDFKCRNDVTFTQEMVDEINRQLDHYCTLYLNSYDDAESKHLLGLGGVSFTYIIYLKSMRLKRKQISVTLKDGELFIHVKGVCEETICYEVPTLAIVNEVYFKHTAPDADLDGAMELTFDKCNMIKESGLPVTEFGTRRRFSREHQENVIKALMDCPSFQGTSNVHFGMKYNIPVKGTQSHQAIMMSVGLPQTSIKNSQKYILKLWAETFGEKSVCLSDTYGHKAFLRDFGPSLAKGYLGTRHDSGDAYEWADSTLKHYEKFGIDPKTKLLAFSDGLTTKKAIEIYETYKDKALLFFGIGTHLTNDIPGLTPLQIVMKLTKCNGVYTSKESDEPGKGMGKCKITRAFIRLMFDLPQEV